MKETTQGEKNAGTPIPENVLHHFVKGFFDRRAQYLEAVEQFGSPLYILETSVLKKKAEQFRAAFEKHLPETSFYYAMKSNNHPDVSRILLEQGYGLDVSSGQELKEALKLEAQDIIFSGPGKTDTELELAVDNCHKTTLLVDSAGEYKRLKGIVNRKKRHINIGVRLNSNPNGLWRKFGISTENLMPLYHEIHQEPYIKLKGLQFHSSWNLSPIKQIEFLHTLEKMLKKMPESFLNTCNFIDIGGGYWPPQGEWLLSQQTLTPYRVEGTPIEKFAHRLAQTIKEKILPLTACRICFEPGRWLCNDAMHILVRVIDKKAKDIVITDAGTNAVGWERFETDYFPVLNLTRRDMGEKSCHILGSLCTPHDVWGYAYFGKSIQEGDILMIPTQGAYTYSLRQHFIKPLPEVVCI